MNWFWLCFLLRTFLCFLTLAAVKDSWGTKRRWTKHRVYIYNPWQIVKASEKHNTILNRALLGTLWIFKWKPCPQIIIYDLQSQENHYVFYTLRTKRETEKLVLPLFNVTSLPSFKKAAGSGNVYLFSRQQISNSKACQHASVFADNNNYTDQNDN